MKNGSVTPSVTSCFPSGSSSISFSMIRSWNAYADHEGGDERDDADEDPVAELREVLDERRLFLVVEAPRDDPAEHGDEG